jgi:hypothetical protein
MISSITKTLLSVAILAAAGVASAANEGDVVINVSASTGSLSSYNGNTNWLSQWTSTAQTPGITITAYALDLVAANNFGATATSSTGNLVYYIGSTPSTGDKQSFLYVAPTAGYYVSALEFNAKLYDSATTVSVALKDNTATALNSSISSFSATYAQGDSVKINFSGSNEGAELSDFKVTLTPIPATNAAIIPTTITDNAFAWNTAWYHIAMTDQQYLWRYNSASSTLALDATDESFDDEYLWCFVGDNTSGYTIYNKAAGTSKAFNVSGSSATIGATGTKIFLSEVSGVSSLDEVSNKYFASTTAGGSSKLGASGGIVGITTGSSANEALIINWAQQTFQIAPSTGTFTRTDGGTSSWKNYWASNDLSGFALSTTYNNWALTSDSNNWRMAVGQATGPWTFTLPEGYMLYGYSLNAKLETSGNDINFSGNGVSLDLTTSVQKFEVTGINNLAGYSFNITGGGNYISEVTDFYATLRRGTIDRGNAIDVFLANSTLGSATYRIPAITTVENGTNSGRIIAVNDYRVTGTADIGSGRRIDLYIATSDDNGKTWTTPTWAKNAAGESVTQGEGSSDGESNSNDHWKCAFGDACIVSDRESGKVLMMAVGGPVGFFNSTRSNPNQLVRWYSSDGGTTWTDAECITEEFLSIFDNNCPWGSIKGQFIGSGRMMQSHYIKKGDYYRLYAVSSVLYDSSSTANYVMYSDDFGGTWHILGDAQNPPVLSAADEPKAEELPDGSVLLAARGRNGDRNFNIFRYTDLDTTEGTWDDVVNTNCGQGSINACNGEIMILPVVNNETSQKTYLALQTFPYGGSRNNVSIIYKSLNGYDDIASPSNFTTWEGRYQVSSMGSAYSTLCWQKDNTLGMIYEEETYGKSYNGVYVNLSLETITGNKYSYSEDTDGSVRQAITKDVIARRLATEVSSEAGQYVGQPSGVGNPAATAAAEAYTADPTYENYVAFNKAIVDGSGISTIQLQQNGIYRIISGHDGLYSDFTNEKYLAADNSTIALKTTEDASDDATEWLIYSREDSDGKCVLYNPSTKLYVGVTPAIYTAVSLSETPTSAGLYTIESAISGHSTFTCSTPTASDYPSLHMNSGGSIVTWQTSSTASQWYMLYLRDGSDVNPEGIRSSIVDIDAQAAPAQVTYFDMMGRRISAPVSGRIYITSQGNKVRF